MEGQEIRINLLETDYMVLKKRKNKLIYLFIILSMLNGMVYSYLYSKTRLTTLQAENEHLKEEYFQAEVLLRDWEDNKNSNELLQKKINSVLGIKKSQTSTLKILDEIEKTLPPDICLTGIEITAEKIALKGFAPTHTPEAVLLAGLRSSKLFADVVMVGSNFNEKAGEVIFQVEIDRKKEKENNNVK